MTHRTIAVMLTACLIAAPTSAREWSPSNEKIIEGNAKMLRGKKPEVIARFLVHPYPMAAAGAARALAEHRGEAVALVGKLLGDRHAGMRAGAVNVLAEMIADLNEGKTGSKRKASEPLKIPPALARVLDLATKLVDDPSPAVQRAMGNLAGTLGDHPVTHKVALSMAASKDASVRYAALRLAGRTPPEVRVKIGMTVSAMHKGNSARLWSLAHKVISGAIDQAKPAMGVIARFLEDQAPMLRGMFADGAMASALKVVEPHAAAPESLVTVAGLCKCYVTIPDGKHGAWTSIEEQLYLILKKMGPAAAGPIRKAVVSLKKFSVSVDDRELRRFQTSRQGMANRIEKLQELGRQ
jgi:hypothetical protein